MAESKQKIEPGMAGIALAFFVDFMIVSNNYTIKVMQKKISSYFLCKIFYVFSYGNSQLETLYWSKEFSKP